MKKAFLTIAMFFVLFLSVGAPAEATMVNDTIKLGLYYGDAALFSANLDNHVGSGYTFGYFDAERAFVPLGSTEYMQISVTADATFYLGSNGKYTQSSTGGAATIGGYHAQLAQAYGSYEEAYAAAEWFDDAYVAYIAGEFYVRVGAYSAQSGASERVAALAQEGIDAAVVSPSRTGVSVTRTGKTEILFQFDQSGLRSLGIMPCAAEGEKANTWFKGYRYYGGFEYQRITGGDLNVINVVNIEDYVKCSIIWEMASSWPIEALKAQACCARTYAARQTRHNSSGFDVCATTDCQVCRGSAACTDYSDSAVDATAGVYLRCDGKLIDAVYYSSNGGASEDVENVWGSVVPYLRGKVDPYEALISIPSYQWTTTYTPAQLTWVLQNKGHSIGTIKSAKVSEYTALGNVKAVTFTDTSGKSLTVRNESCRAIFASATYGKSAGSMRFSIDDGSGSGYFVNSGERIGSVNGSYMISGSGTASLYSGKDDATYVITASGTSVLGKKSSGGGEIVLRGTGSGHNVGLSQYGAKAMAENGFSYEDILNFYYTDITIG